MEEDTAAKVQNIVSTIFNSPNFRMMVSETISSLSGNGQPQLPNSTVQPQQSSQTSTIAPLASAIPSTSTCDRPIGGPQSLLLNLRSLFPSTRGKIPSFSKSRRKNNWSTTFHRDVILLDSPKGMMTLKGSKKVEAFNKGFALSDVKFDCTWDKRKIFQYMYELFPVHLSKEDTFEILVPEGGRLMKIDETREEIDGCKLKRIFNNRKAVYLRKILDASTTTTAPLLMSETSEITLDDDTLSVDGDADFAITRETTTVNIIEKEDEDDIFHREVETVVAESLLQHEVEDMTLQSLMNTFSRRIKDDCLSHFNIYRKEVFACCKRATNRKKFDPFAKISVMFSDPKNNLEGAIDAGGPQREMFRLLFKELKESTLFEGVDKKFISFNFNSLEKHDYFEAGRLMALAVVHVHQGPTFFSDLLFSVIVYGIEETKRDEQFVDENVLKSIHSLQNESNLLKLQDIVVNDPVFSLAGIHFISSLEEKSRIIENALKYYNFYRVKAALDQLIDGLKTCDVYAAMRKYPDLLYPLMCSDPPSLTPKTILKLFEVSYSPEGSNKRDIENRVVTYWCDYVYDCSDNSEDCGVTLEEILIFATSCSNIPPLGFDITPTIQFLHNKAENLGIGNGSSTSHCFPEANTCSLELHLPVIHKSYDNFKEDMDYAIENCKIFGKA